MTITHVLIVWILVTQRVTNNELGCYSAGLSPLMAKSDFNQRRRW